MAKIAYTNPATTIPQQITKLQNKGLTISDISYASNVLTSINYYRLSGYWLYYETSRDVIRPGTTFEQVMDMYYFDRDLRSLIFEGISRFEVTLRTRWAYETGIKYGPQKFYYKKYCKDECEVMSFGNLSCWYTNLKEVPSSNPTSPGNAKDAIASFFKVDAHLLESWIHSLAVLRNQCAHQSRIVNKKLTIIPKKPKSNKNPIKNIWSSQSNCYYNLILVLIFLNQNITSPSHWVTEIKDFLKRNKTNCIDFLGFSNDWEKDSFWA